VRQYGNRSVEIRSAHYTRDSGYGVVLSEKG
jgi:hypothetical protein